MTVMSSLSSTLPQLSDGYQMQEHHRAILSKARIYLLHNMRPTESLWSTFISKEVLSFDMIDEIKACRITSEKIGLLLDFLPARGPDAFNKFCEGLLECDHAHVADYLKNLEATDQFRSEIRPHCSDFSDHMLERFVTIFKRNTPMVQRFAERKFELILQEQEQDLQQKDAEVRELEGKNMMLSLEVTQLRSFLNTCFETSENITAEVQRDFISRSFLRDETKHLENLKSSLQGLSGFDKVVQFYTNMQLLLAFLEKHVGVKVTDNSGGGGTGGARGRHGSSVRTGSARAISAMGRTIHDKMQGMVNLITGLSDDFGAQVHVPGCEVRKQMENVLKQFKEIIDDVFSIRDSFKRTLKQKRKLEGEVLSLLHNYQEIRRLEREQKEKQSHIADLSKHGLLLKKKTKQKKQLDQVQCDIEQKKMQLQEIQKHVSRNIKSADVRMQHMLELLPDLDPNDTDRCSSSAYFPRADTDLFSEDAASRPTSQVPGVRPFSVIAKAHMSNVVTEETETDVKEHDDAKKKADDDGNSNKNPQQPRLLDKRPTQSKAPVPNHMRLRNSKPAAKVTNKPPEEVKKSVTLIGGIDVDEWIATQQQQLKAQDDKLKEQQRQIAAVKEENAKKAEENAKKFEYVIQMDKDKNDNSGDKDINANVVETKSSDVVKSDNGDNTEEKEKVDRQKSAEGSEKEKGWWEVNKGSATSRSTGSRPPSGQKSKLDSGAGKEVENVEAAKEAITEPVKEPVIAAKLSGRPYYKLHERRGMRGGGVRGGSNLVAKTTDNRSSSPMKRSMSQAAGTSLSMATTGEAIGMGLTDPGSSQLKQSYSNMIKDMQSAEKAKARQSLQTNRIEIRLPSK